MTAIPVDHPRYAEWDAAYVLGALAPVERHEYETHLAECAACRAAVAELAALPGLLSALPVAEAAALLEESPVAGSPHDLTASLARAVTRRRRRTRGWTITAIAAAAAIAVGALVIPPIVTAAQQRQPDATVALAAAKPGPLAATVELTSHRWGTSIDMDCTYQDDPSGYGGGRYALTVTSADGASTQVTTWTAEPGDRIRLGGATAVPEQDIRSIELRDAATGAVLLSATL